MKKNKNVLVVAAHPDDEILGCGGTIAHLIGEGHRVTTLILGEGVTGRDEKRNRQKRRQEISALKKQVERANRILGVRNIFMRDFPDNRFDTIPLLEVVKSIEKVKDDVNPSIIFTHYRDDLNIDHRVIYNAVITAARPLPDTQVTKIYSFEVLSSTEYSYPVTFSPDTFFDITNVIALKLEALAEYKGEIRNYPHPRSAEGVKVSAQNWGIRCGRHFAEAFVTVRCIEG